MDIGRMLTWSAERHPHQRAVGGPRPMTFRQWDAYTNQLARALADLGVRPAQRVMLHMANGTELASCYLAVQKLGAVAVPLSTRFGLTEVEHCLRDCSPTLVVTDATTSDLSAQARAALPDPPVSTHAGDPDDAAPGSVALAPLVQGQTDGPLSVGIADHQLSVLLYTSGTTGRPKGVPRTHAAEHAATVAHILQSGQGGNDVTLGVMPLFHTMGVRTLLASVLTGGTWVPQRRFDADESLDLITREGITALYLVPTLYWSLLQTGRLQQLTSLHRIGYAGAPMTPDLAGRLIDAVHPRSFLNHYGSTEIFTFTVEPDVAARPGSAGRAGPFSRVRVIATDADAGPTDVVAPGEPGQVIASMGSPEAFTGYWRRPDADRTAIRNGWYHTGDLATRDDDGNLWYQGRVDDMIISGGENIYPADIEAAIAACPAVADNVVVGLPDERWGQSVTAFVVPHAGVDPAQTVRDAQHFIRTSTGLPSLKRPKRVIAVDRIPRSPVGKILRRRLADGAYDALADTAAAGGANRTETTR
ncbi:long-chain fatty acid--CoA ligase [Micromonospora sp. 15K316]|uniref:class I adenylate-forming enzyme family protein n=1 Tax=Micromonospora sp. 15K316 TaxID=2530376 RepID=UPI001042F74A|nr:class I adenylate-forming enzyme family protein [Micromonospora sp. 15K316]TDC40356.1 long-chain fatty acid--CoA ligase [Micromonospora sp. 15K316]